MAAQAFKGCSPEFAGRPLEAPGDGVSRWMVATSPEDPGEVQNPAWANSSHRYSPRDIWTLNPSATQRPRTAAYDPAMKHSVRSGVEDQWHRARRKRTGRCSAP